MSGVQRVTVARAPPLALLSTRPDEMTRHDVDGETPLCAGTAHQSSRRSNAARTGRFSSGVGGGLRDGELIAKCRLQIQYSRYCARLMVCVFSLTGAHALHESAQMTVTRALTVRVFALFLFACIVKQTIQSNNVQNQNNVSKANSSTSKNGCECNSTTYLFSGRGQSHYPLPGIAAIIFKLLHVNVYF